jgi:hypothetical protein
MQGYPVLPVATGGGGQTAASPYGATEMHHAKKHIQTKANPKGTMVKRSATQDPEDRLVKLAWGHGRKQQIEECRFVESLDKGQEDAGSAAQSTGIAPEASGPEILIRKRLQNIASGQFGRPHR